MNFSCARHKWETPDRMCPKCIEDYRQQIAPSQDCAAELAAEINALLGQRKKEVFHYRTFNGTACGIKRVIGRVRYGDWWEVTCKRCLRSKPSLRDAYARPGSPTK